MIKKDILQIIEKEKVVSIIRGLSFSQTKETIECLINSGVKVLEITMNSEDALEGISYSRERYKEQAIIGAGTVLDVEDARKAIEAGAQFILTPSYSEDVVNYCNEKNVCIIPGVLTPSEIVAAYRNGCEMVKIFPVSAFSYDYISQISKPLDKIKFMAVGGINSKNINYYLENGAHCVGVGSLIDKGLINKGDYEGLSKYVKNFLKNI